MKCRAQQQGFCLLQKNQITEVEINMLSVGPISRPREIFYLHFFFFTFNFLLLSLAPELPLAGRDEREGRGPGRVAKPRLPPPPPRGLRQQQLLTLRQAAVPVVCSI